MTSNVLLEPSPQTAKSEPPQEHAESNVVKLSEVLGIGGHPESLRKTVNSR